MYNVWYLTLKIKLTYSLPIFSLLLANKNRLISAVTLEKTMWRVGGGYDDDEVEGG